MKKYLFILVISLCLAVTSPLSAQQRFKRKRLSAAADTALLLPAGTWVYGIGIHATSASAQMGIYDSATLGAASSPIDEVGEATQYKTVDRPWAEPIYFANGVTVIISNGVAFIDYGSTS